ncbi:MAG: phosphohydrolase [Bacilli bacterium]|nr:phosphohydrolase [Bacilli bacterium]
MKVFAIGDPHLSFTTEKPMDIFGDQWSDHPERMAENWRQIVDNEDWVLIPGDLSWAMTLEEAAIDLDFLGELPGQKIVIRGNHDYWWSTLTKVRKALPPSLHAIQNDSLAINEQLVICGTRGWTIPGSREFQADDLRIYEREVQRLQLSLAHARKSMLNRPAAKLWAMMHYPPLYDSTQTSEFVNLLQEYGVSKCIFGHIHGPGIPGAVTGVIEGIDYQLVSCDAIDFSPRLILG